MASELIPASQAFHQARAHPALTKWPARGEENRLEPEAWPTPRASFSLRQGAKVFAIGSCFARNIEEHLFRLGFSLPTLGFQVPPAEWKGRPNGIINKYTPPAIFQELNWAAGILQKGGAFALSDATDHLVELDNGTVVDTGLAGFFPVSRERAIERRHQLYALVIEAFASEVVVITPGLIEVWFDREREIYIQQAPTGPIFRRYPDRFAFKILDFEECRRYLFDSIALIRRVGRPDTKFLLTTSPVPLARTFGEQDILTANMYGKSMLRVAVEDTTKKFPDVDYFPSYESVMLTKADDIWSDDLRHVSDSFVGNIVTRMIQAYVTEPSNDDDLLSWARACAGAGLPERAQQYLGSIKDPERFAGLARSIFNYLLALPAPGQTTDLAIQKTRVAEVNMDHLFKSELLQFAQLALALGDLPTARAAAQRACAERFGAKTALGLLARIEKAEQYSGPGLCQDGSVSVS